MPRKHAPLVTEKAVGLYVLDHLTQHQVEAELNRLIDAGELDNGGRHVSHAWVRTVTEGQGRIDDDWDFTKATPKAVKVIAPIYEWAVSVGDEHPWPNPIEADWWIKVRTLAPDMPHEHVFRIGRYAALRPTAEQKRIARTLLLWSVRGKAELERRKARRRVRVTRLSDQLHVGGTAIADMYSHGPHR